MKKTMKMIVAAIAVCGLFASCSTKEDLEVQEQQEKGVIRLGVGDATRASINSVADLAQYSGDKVGIFGVEAAENDADPIAWGNTKVMNNVQTTGIDADGGAMHWMGIYYYPLESDDANPNKFVKFCAYHPYAAAGTEGDNYLEELSGAAPQLHFTLTGQEDVMCAAAPVVGSNEVDPGKLSFKHVLTQLTFALLDSKDSFKDATLEGISIHANTKGSMNVENGTLGAWSEQGVLELPIAESGIAINAKDVQNLDGAVMLEPGKESFLIDVKTSVGTFENIEIVPTTESETAFGAAKSYRVTLKFTEKKLFALSAEVQPWETGHTGGGTLE